MFGNAKLEFCYDNPTKTRSDCNTIPVACAALT